MKTRLYAPHERPELDRSRTDTVAYLRSILEDSYYTASDSAIEAAWVRHSLLFGNAWLTSARSHDRHTLLSILRSYLTTGYQGDKHMRR